MSSNKIVRAALALLIVAALGCPDLTSPGSGDAKITLQALNFGGCGPSAAPLPGWKDCTATVSLSVPSVPSSGYISVYFNYPDAGSFYHGQAFVSVAGGVTVPMINTYLPSCATTVPTTVDVYNGPTSNPNAPLIISIPTTIHATC